MTRRLPRWAVPAAVALLAAASLVFALTTMGEDTRALLTAQLALRWDRLALALGVVFLNHLVQAGLWHLFTRDLTGASDWLRDVLRFSLSALTRNLPGAFYWSAATRMALYRAQGDTAGAALALGVELVIQVCTGAGVAVALLAWPWGLPAGIILAGLPLLPAVRQALPQLASGRRIASRWPNLAAQVSSLARLRTGTVAVASGLYVLVWLVGGLFIELLGQALGAALPGRAALYGAWVAASLAGIVGSVALGGLGILREFTLTGVLSPEAGVVTAGWLAVLSRLLLIGGTWVSGLVTAGACQLILKRRGDS